MKGHRGHPSPESDSLYPQAKRSNGVSMIDRRCSFFLFVLILLTVSSEMESHSAQAQWVVLAGKNSRFASNIPDEASMKLKELYKQGAEINSIAFAHNGGWVILSDKKGDPSSHLSRIEAFSLRSRRRW